MIVFMPGVLMREETIEDLRGIIVPMAAENPQRARRFSDGLNETLETLVTFPIMGSPRKIANVSVRELRVFPIKDF